MRITDVVNRGTGEELHQAVGHGQTSTKNRNNGNIVLNLHTVKSTHRGLDGLAGNTQAASSLKAQVEGNLLELSTELIGRSVHVSKLSHLSSNKRVGRLKQRHC